MSTESARQYQVFEPKAGTPRYAVFCLHGFTENWQECAEYMRAQDMADDLTARVIVPSGSLLIPGTNIHYWQTHKGPGRNVDLAFLNRLWIRYSPGMKRAAWLGESAGANMLKLIGAFLDNTFSVLVSYSGNQDHWPSVPLTSLQTVLVLGNRFDRLVDVDETNHMYESYRQSPAGVVSERIFEPEDSDVPDRPGAAKGHFYATRLAYPLVTRTIADGMDRYESH